LVDLNDFDKSIGGDLFKIFLYDTKSLSSDESNDDESAVVKKKIDIQTISFRLSDYNKSVTVA